MLDYLVLGHIAQDLTPEGVRLGGTAAYAGLTAHALGLRTGLLTAAADEAVLDALAPLEVRRLPSPHSTVFENRYGPLGRTQFLHSRAEPLTPASLPDNWRGSDIVHLGPIANEVDPDLIAQFPKAFIGLTPQGWMRRWNENGKVQRGEWAQADPMLATASATVISIEDVAEDWKLAERWGALARVLVVTEGPAGATLFWKGERQRFPAPPVNVVDATGAGDIFAATFFIKLHQTGDAPTAVRFAIALASDSVTRVGIAGVPTTAAIRAALDFEV